MTDKKEKKVQTTVRLRASVEQRLKRHVYQLKIERAPEDDLPTREGEIESAIDQYLDRFETQPRPKHTTPDQAHAHHLLDEILRRGNEEEKEMLDMIIELLLQKIEEREHGKEADENAAEVFQYVKKRARIIAEHRLALSRK